MSDGRSIPPSPPHRTLQLAAESFEPLVSLFKGQHGIRLPDSPSTSVAPSISHHATNTPPPLRPISGQGHARSHSSSSVSSLKGMNWFPFSSSSAAHSRKPNNEVRTTVLNLVRDLVLEHSSGSPAALGILQSCAEACNSHNVSLSDILQEKFIEGHSPLYWAIVKRRQQEANEDMTDPDLLDALLKRSAPLDGDTVLELRQACMATSDHSMFQRLSILPHFTTTSGVDRVILGNTLPDDVTVELGSGNEGTFTVHLTLFQFHKRMMLANEITHEFIARNRIWRISFVIMPPGDNRYGPPAGSWCVSLSLQESSPPTWFDGQISLPNSNQCLRLRSKQVLEGPRGGIPASQIIVPMDDSPDFATLQYSGSAFNPDDEMLSVSLAAKLRKPDPSVDSFIS